MPNVLVRNLDDALLADIRQQAAAHHRSVNAEITALLESAVRGGAVTPRVGLTIPHPVAVGGPAMSRDLIYGDDDGR
jgi:plasmid stability protein